MSNAKAPKNPLLVGPGSADQLPSNKRAARAEKLQGQIPVGGRLQQDLRWQEALFRELMESIHRVFWLASVDHRQMFYISRSYKRVWGRNCNHVLRNPMAWREAIHPDDRARIEAELARDQGEPFTREFRIVRPDRTIRWILGRGFQVRDKQGHPYRIAGLAEDITERKQAEANLQHLAAIIESSEEVIISKDLEGRIQTWNPAAERCFGYRSEEVIGRNIALLIPEERRAEEVAILERLRKGVRLQHFETIRLHKDGTPIPVSLMTSPLRDASGKIFGASKIVRDLSARKQLQKVLEESETRYTSLFQKMMEGVLYCRMLFENGQPRDFIFLEVNQAFENLTGLRNIVGRKASELIPGIREADPELFERYGRVALTGQPERFVVHITKLNRWFSVSAYSPKKEHFVAVFDNITERKQAEEALKKSHAQLRALSARLQSVREEEATRMAREIHDDLGQKLTGLKMDSRRAERKIERLASSPAASSLLDTLVSATELVDSITASVQEIAANLRPEMLDKLGLGAALRYESRRFQERTGVLCGARLPETELNLSTEVSTALFRIFQECLTNIARHAHATKIKAALKLKDGWATMSVQDNGRGITEAEIANPKSLGLLGMKERTALLGGEIVLHHGPGGGTIVTARLPQSGTFVQAKESV
jgi:PAS domain S-box-containing protein